MNSTTKSLLAALTLATSIAGITGCTAPAPEGFGSSSSKLLAPQAVFKGPSTADTQKVLGISEWRVFRGKTEYIVTGYDNAGKAVKGVAFAFSGASHASKAKITGRVLDGSRASGSHEYGGNTSSPSLESVSQTFVDHAFHDLTMLRMGLKTSITRSAVRSGEACSGDLTKIVMSSLQCITSAKATGSSVSKAVKVKQCVAAASSASKAVASCQNVGTTAAPAATAPKAPAAPAAAAKAPAASGAKAPASSGSSSGSTKSAEKPADGLTDAQKAANAKQDAEQDAEDAKKEAADKKADAKTDGTPEAAKEAAKPAPDPAADPNATPADPNADPNATPADPNADPNATPADPNADPNATPADPNADPNATPGTDAGSTVPQDTQVADATTGADAATTASADQTCTSCSGTAASDVQASPDTGAVSAASGSSADAPVDTAGDPGGGDTSTGGVTDA
jgi:hypothetical protein